MLYQFCLVYILLLHFFKSLDFIFSSFSDFFPQRHQLYLNWTMPIFMTIIATVWILNIHQKAMCWMFLSQLVMPQDNCGTFRRWDPVEGMTLKVTLGPQSLSFWFLATIKWIGLFHHMLLSAEKHLGLCVMYPRMGPAPHLRISSQSKNQMREQKKG